MKQASQSNEEKRLSRRKYANKDTVANEDIAALRSHRRSIIYPYRAHSFLPKTQGWLREKRATLARLDPLGSVCQQHHRAPAVRAHRPCGRLGQVSQLR